MSNFFTSFFKAVTSGFVTADRSRSQALPQTAAPRDARSDYSSSIRAQVVGLARYYAQNDPSIRESIRDFSLYAVASGLKPQPCSANAGWNKLAMLHWERWWKYPEITRRFTGRRVQKFMCEALDHDGEIFIVKVLDEHGSPAIQLVESHQVCADSECPGDEDGIRRNAEGRPIAYNIRRDDGTCSLVPADAVIHLAAWERPSSVRGIPTIQHVIPSTGARGRLEELTLRKATNEALTYSWLEQDAEDALTDEEDSYADPLTPEQEKAHEEKLLREAAEKLRERLGGTTIALPAGQHLKQYVNQTPGSQYTPYIKHLNEQNNLGLIPYGFIDPSAYTGTAVRQVTAHTGRIIADRQDDLIEALTQIWQFFIACEIAKGALPAVEDGYFPEWLTPRHITMDYGRDENADRENVRGGITPLRDHMEQRGFDFEKTIEAQIQDRLHILKRCEVAGISPEAAFPILFAPDGHIPVAPAPSDEDDTPKKKQSLQNS